MAMVQITTAGVALLQANTGPVTVNTFELGSGYNYTPEPTATTLMGTEVYSGSVPAPIAVNANLVQYSIYLDYPVGPFAFGEFGLYVGTTLFALGTLPELLNKIPLTSATPGNSIRIDVFLSMVGTNYQMWLNLNQSNNQFRLGIIQSPDYLPPSPSAVPNAYVIQGANVSQTAFLAYTDTQGLWNFDAYDYAQQAAATIVAADSKSVTINYSQYVQGMSPAYFGSTLIQFSTGALYGVVRYVETAVISGTTVTLGFATPLAMIPVMGDKILAFSRNILSTTVQNLPPATTTMLGAVMVGPTLTVSPTGLLNVNDSMLPVTSVNGQTGMVELTASDIINIAKVAITGQYADLLNAPALYVLEPATTTTLGGVKAPSTTEQTLMIAADGTIDLAFTPVKSVNGNLPNPATGNVTVTVPTYEGLINPTMLSASTDLNTVIVMGLYYVSAANVPTLVNAPPGVTMEATIEVVPLYTTTQGDVIQRFTTATTMWFRGMTNGVWGGWQQVSTLVTHEEQSILATTMGQTTFMTSGYQVGYIEVFLAGLRLRSGVDYTATDGTNISIVNTALAAQIQVGAVLTVSKFSSFTVADSAALPMLAASNGAYLVGYGNTTVGAFLAALTAGTTAGMFTTVAISGNTPSTSTITGALTVVGGTGVEGNLNVGMLSSISSNVTPIASQALPVTGTLLRLTDIDGVPTKLLVDSYVNTGNPTSGVALRGARGTAAIPTAVQNMDIIGDIAARGYGATMFPATSTGSIQFVSEGAFTDSSQPTAISFLVTPSGSIAKTQMMRLTSTGVLELLGNIASTTDTTGTLVVTGGLGVSGAVNAGMNVNAGSSVSAGTTVSAVTSITAGTTVKSSLGGFVFPDSSMQGTAIGRNRVINGGMDVDQRNLGAAQTITAGGPLAYTVDRWYAYCTGANVTGQRVMGSGSGLDASAYQYQFTGATGVTDISFGQRIEAANSFDLNGETATLSVDLANSLLTTVTWTVYYANTANTFGTLAAPTVTQIATGTFTVTPALTRYSTQIPIPAAATTGLQVVFSVGAQTSGTWDITNVQLEAGMTASPYARVNHGDVWNQCFRYYQYIDQCEFWGYAGAAAQTVGQTITFPKMRIIPTVTVGSWTYTNTSTGTVFSTGINRVSFTATSVATGATATTATAITLMAEL